MIIGIGADLIRISRVRGVAERHPQRIGKKIYTPAELAYCRSKAEPAQSLAGRFAAKEAVMKALGTGWRGGVRFVDIEVIRDPQGKPGIELHGRVAQLARKMGINVFHLSITHDGDLAMATVIAEKTS